LLLIDIQNDYFPGGAMTLVGADRAAANAAHLLRSFRERGQSILHVQHIAARPGATFFRPDTDGARIHAAVQPLAGEVTIVKHFPNSFRDTDLLASLRSAGVSKLVIAGMMTHMCVDTTVRAAADLGFGCSLAADACATKDLEFEGERVAASHVQLAYLAAINGSFATVASAERLGATA